MDKKLHKGIKKFLKYSDQMLPYFSKARFMYIQGQIQSLINILIWNYHHLRPLFTAMFQGSLQCLKEMVK